MIWNILEFENLVQLCYGEEQLKKLMRPLSSVSWKLMLANYHAFESKRLYQSYFSKESVEGSTEELVHVIGQFLKAASGSEEADKFKEARILSEAHLISYAQSLHSVADILAQVIYLGINLENNLTKPIPEYKRNLHYVYEGIRNENYAIDVVKVLGALKQSPEFLYLQAYVNTTKHYSLIDVTHQISLKSNTTSRYGILILPFEYKGHCFQQKWADDFSIRDFKTILESIFCVGSELNRFLRNIAVV